MSAEGFERSTDDPQNELERLRALLGPNEASYEDLQSDVKAASEAVKTAEAEVGELRGELTEMRVDLWRARQDQHHVQRVVLMPAIMMRRWWRRLLGR